MADMIPRAEVDALVAAAYEVAAQNHDRHAKGYSKTCQAADAAAHREHAKRIRAFTPDDARAALKAMLAEAEKRGEKRGMLRAAEIAWARVEGNSGRDREAAEISMSIRAEAEE